METTPASDEQGLSWVPFFAEMADTLKHYQGRRAELLIKLRDAAEASSRPSLFNFLWTYGKGSARYEADDVDPFTIFAVINRQISLSSKIAVCTGFKQALGLSSPVPTGFDGVPQVNNMRSRFESRDGDAGNTTFYDNIWALFTAGLELATPNTPTVPAQTENPAGNRNERASGEYGSGGVELELDTEGEAYERFVTAFDTATAGRARGSYTMALFWIRAQHYLPLDSRTIDYLRGLTSTESPDEEPIAARMPWLKLPRSIKGSEYIDVCNNVRAWIAEDASLPATFPELSDSAYRAPAASDGDVEPEEAPSSPTAQPADDTGGTEAVEAAISYTVADIVAAGCFIPKDGLEAMLTRWREKKNLILQGPPGTGKTWLARKLAYALIGTDSDETITAVQFHPSTSYEDFVQGLRPDAERGLVVQDGPFMDAIYAAAGEEDEKTKHVVLIEEINRGNPAQIFGEMLTLLEADKRDSGSALKLLYASGDDDAIYVPPNLYVIGTMNQADRSLAMVDMALRRRFGFVTLKPSLGKEWLQYCTSKCGRDEPVLTQIAKQITAVNTLIEDDVNLGSAYCIGHSFVTPGRRNNPLSADETKAWFGRVVDTDLRPLLEEYWHDDPDRLGEALALLREA
ncbi:McrB family protein [Corynebacterium heidelbergense]|nr:AAA family ATPase [Corynebacterium heidelbergense]WCZ36146.1 5-methylcytosine-specific restriction enzyme B [Corynebacterium heidelbergense]